MMSAQSDVSPAIPQTPGWNKNRNTTSQEMTLDDESGTDVQADHRSLRSVLNPFRLIRQNNNDLKRVLKTCMENEFKGRQ